MIKQRNRERLAIFYNVKITKRKRKEVKALHQLLELRALIFDRRELFTHNPTPEHENLFDFQVQERDTFNRLYKIEDEVLAEKFLNCESLCDSDCFLHPEEQDEELLDCQSGVFNASIPGLNQGMVGAPTGILSNSIMGKTASNKPDFVPSYPSTWTNQAKLERAKQIQERARAAREAVAKSRFAEETTSAATSGDAQSQAQISAGASEGQTLPS